MSGRQVDGKDGPVLGKLGLGDVFEIDMGCLRKDPLDMGILEVLVALPRRQRHGSST